MADPLVQAHETHQVNKSLTRLPEPNFTGLKLNADIIINDLVLNTIDGNGVVWVVEDIEGWWDLPGSKIQDIPRGWADGSYDVTGKWTNRNLTLKGSILPPDPSLAAAARATLIEAVSLVYVGGWLRVYEEPQKAAYVRLSGNPKITTENARGRINFSIGLKAVDPIKYGWNDLQADGYVVTEVPCKNVATTETGIVTINNAGTWDTTCIIEIDGPIVGPGVVVNQTTGELILIISPVASLSTLAINTYTQEVALDGDVGDARAMLDVLTNWIVLAPGDNQIDFYDAGAVNSTATMRIYHRPAWLG